MKSIDFKSLLIGILGTALVMVLMGQSRLERHYDVECVTLPSQGDFIQCKRFKLNNPAWDDLESNNMGAGTWDWTIFSLPDGY